ncbi:MAG TPA: TIGR02281 family clan AA aspartic protease [Burkholderiales bacterium]|nr:TIGR02281 family clan AA aspartic protease [Burkholderiales bacterium]
MAAPRFAHPIPESRRRNRVGLNQRLLSLTCLLFLFIPGLASAMDVNVVGLFPGKVVVTIDGGKPRTLSNGQTSPEGVKLISANSESAEFEIDGKRQVLGLGQAITANFAATENASVTLFADSNGHFFSEGSVNGAPVKFLIDTGATMISISSVEAKRLGINYLKGQRGLVSTANGVVPVYTVKLDEVKLGDISMNNVDAQVHEGNALPLALLGMSFLNRVEMKREGTQMTLIKRY